MKYGIAAVGALVAALMLVGAGFADTLPEGPGLAAKHPGDVGLDQNPSVIVYENFEEGSLEALAAAPSSRTVTGKRWTDLAGATGEGKTLSIVSDPPQVHSGKYGLEVLVNESSAESGGLFARLKPGYDQLYGRFYIKFDRDYPYESHTGLALDATNEDAAWPIGKAGIVPKGDERFGGTLEPEPGDWKAPPGFWCFYVYWHEMKGNYGNVFQSDPPTPVARDQWICCEMMFKANSKPEAHDGECAYWIDGKLRYHGTGFNWRTADNLKLNAVNLLHYMNKAGEAWSKYPGARRQWFDDVVIATEYIGPLTKPGAQEVGAGPVAVKDVAQRADWRKGEKR